VMGQDTATLRTPRWSMATRGDSELQYPGKVFGAIQSVGHRGVVQVLAPVWVVNVERGDSELQFLGEVRVVVQSAFYKPGWSIWTRGDSEVQFLGKVFDAI